ncbi:MAG: hypothetical protein U0269_05410 [Polyangiales bacterium]
MHYLRFAVIVTATLASACTTTQPRPRADPGNTVRADGRDYVVIACRGAKSAGVSCPPSAPIAAYFRGGVVCQPRGDAAESVREVEASTIPRSVCEGLANGCDPALAPPAAQSFAAITDEERSRITSLGFTIVPCGERSFRLDFARPAPSAPAQTDPSAAVDPDAGASAPQPEPVAPPAEESADQLVARTEAIRVALVREHAAESTGVGVCATAPGETLPSGAACVRVDVRDQSARPDVIAQRFAEVARAGSAALRLSFEFQPRMGARCAANDPDCAPLVGNGVCPEAIGIRPGGGRTAISTAVNAGVDLRRYESGSCRSDGDCAIGGCGQHCVAAGTASFASTCEGIEALEAAACGCVRGRCRWFVAASN